MNKKEKARINWGIVGAGRMSGWFSEALAALPEEACLYAAASRTEEKARAFAAKYGYRKAYGSYEALLCDPAVDVVYIGTPVREHFGHIMMCLEAGKPVLCEKSLTVNAGQAREAVRVSREKGLFLMEAVWTKCQPVFRQICSWCETGKMGTVQAADIRFYTKAGRSHRLFCHETAGGALLDLGIYPVMYACALFGGAPVSVQSHTVMSPEARVDLEDSVVLTFPGGGFAHLSCGLGTEKLASLYAVGTKGRILLADEFFFQAQRAELIGYDQERLAVAEGPFLKNGYEFEAMEVMRCLRAGKTESELVRQEDSITVMEILDTCRANAGFRYDFE